MLNVKILKAVYTNWTKFVGLFLVLAFILRLFLAIGVMMHHINQDALLHFMHFYLF